MHEVMPSGGFDLEAENGIAAPAGTPREIVDKLSAEVLRILAERDVTESLVAQGFEMAPGSGSELEQRIARDLAKYKLVVSKAHAQVD